MSGALPSSCGVSGACQICVGTITRLWIKWGLSGDSGTDIAGINDLFAGRMAVKACRLLLISGSARHHGRGLNDLGMPMTIHGAEDFCIDGDAGQLTNSIAFQKFQRIVGFSWSLYGMPLALRPKSGLLKISFGPRQQTTFLKLTIISPFTL